MVSVGILSMQRIYNYGSFLQAFALKQILEDLGASVQFVDYHPGKTLEGEAKSFGVLRKVSRGLESFKLRTSLNNKLKYINYKWNYSKKYFPYLDITEKMNYQPKVDLLVIGSDEVFNCVQANANVGFSPELFGQYNRAKRLISYAASFGNTTLEKLRQHNIVEQVSDWISDFDSLSVRDDNSERIVSDLLGNSPQKNIDPVLAFDYINRFKEIPENVPVKGKYLLLYGYSGRFSRAECEKIREIANKRDLKIICIGGLQHCCDIFVDCSPFEVIAYFNNAEAVITDTFHGTILSIITHSEFVTIIRNSGYGNFQKLNDLLVLLKLTDRISPTIEDVDAQLQQQIEYGEADAVIAQERARTYDYLKNEINKSM